VDDTTVAVGFASSALYVDKYFSARDKKNVEEITKAIINEFLSDISNSDWMDEKTKQQAKEKLVNLILKIGYPEFIIDPLKLDLYYDNLNVTDSYFRNKLNSNKFKMIREMKKLFHNTDKTEWRGPPSVVAAAYSADENAIIITAGILQKPFYDPSFPKSLTFGAIGSIIGHEVTHGFDNMGRRFDMNGNMLDWWSNKSSEVFEKRSQCFIEQYNEYTVNGQHVNGRSTLGENIADNGGLKLSYAAYNTWLKNHEGKDVLLEHNEDPLLPSLNMTRHQQFFLAMAQTWCASFTDQATKTQLTSDPHSPPMFRVKGVLRNFPAFYEHFNCASSTSCMENKQCSLW